MKTPAQVAKEITRIVKTIDDEIRLMSRTTRQDLKKAAKIHYVTEPSLVWLICDVFSDGHIKSRAYKDAPDFVIDDGLIQEQERGELFYTSWEYTEKAREILALRERL